MKALLQFELGNYFKKPGFYVALFLLLIFGSITGAKFSLSIGPDVFMNSPYTVAYMTGLLSLFCIFFSTLLATQILFREKDNNFSLILYATPLRKEHYMGSRFAAVTLLSFICFLLLMLGFLIGQQLVSDRSSYTHFNILNYLQPLWVFGGVNTIFCCAMLCCVAWLTKNKLMLYVTGLFIYIAYMVTLIFSGSPLMATGMPQSQQVINISASLDPFGLSGYFLQTSNWSVLQRNTELIVPDGIFFFNRVAVVLLSIILLLATFKTFSFFKTENIKQKKTGRTEKELNQTTESIFTIALPSFGWRNNWFTLVSFTKIDLTYISKSIAFLLATIGLLFHLSMEMYGNIEKGIRLPQKYVSSGLMTTVIIESFPTLFLIVILYYGQEIFWRSRNSNFHLIENSTPANKSSLFFSKWLTLSIMVLFFSTLVILLGIVFQVAYDYPLINPAAYAGVYLFVSLPLILSAGIIIFIQKLVNHKYIGLIVSSGVILLTATTIGKQVISHPLLLFQVPYNGLYSDLNGFGSYMGFYGWRILFGAIVVITGSIAITQVKKFRLPPATFLLLITLIVLGLFAGKKVISDYHPISKDIVLQNQADYEKKYRRFQGQAQPIVVDINTTIDLFPGNNSYDAQATYILRNATRLPINDILVNFSDGIKIQEATFTFKEESVKVINQHTVVSLKKPLQPGDSAQFYFKISYHWSPVNGHQSFNAIVENGSFIRLSKYFPSIGYSQENEIESEGDRNKFGLGKATALTLVDAPRVITDDFINLKMKISTSLDQVAIGVGELVKQWSTGNRNYFQYNSLSPIPFHFAISSASYAVKKAVHQGKQIEIYYHPGHYENVEHLLKNSKLTLDYCEANFGSYPFKTIRFAEVSGFTRGFAATAYPATIFMTENMVFNANINADNNQDVINELAGHELAHLWWGNSQISPDWREGGRLMTETLAMYTELMLVKRMHGKKRVMENVHLHQGIYLNERGFSEEQPLFKVQYGNIHLLYSKGLVVMYQLHELIGEKKLNLALRHFLEKYAHPNNAISTDFIHELYQVTDKSLHPAIDDLLKRITLYDFKMRKTTLTKIADQYELHLNASADKYYEDGKGNRTKALFTDSVELVIYLKDGKEKLIKLPVINNEITGKIILHEKPVAVEFDPDVKFIKIESGKQVLL